MNNSKPTGEKLRFGNAACRRPKNVRKVTDYGRKVPKANRAVTLASDHNHSQIDRNSDDNAGIDSLNRGSQYAGHTVKYGSNAISRRRQKHEIKKGYAEAKSGKAAGSAAAKNAGKAAKESKKLSERVWEFAVKHRHGLIIGGVLLLLILIISGSVSSCSVMFEGGADVVIGSSYTAEDADILDVEADYCAMENALQARLNNIRSEYPGYADYSISQDQIGHNPFELASYLTVVYEDYTREQVQSALRELFDDQYRLTVNVSEPQSGYFVLKVELDNKGLSAALMNLSEDQMGRYSLLMQTLGNKPDIFGDSIYAMSLQDVPHYDIPPEALTDERFARMIREAEKYLGYPYVWGGSSPSTSFDCSGYVSWVINHCGNGWNVGRRGSDGLLDICTVIRPSDAKPGDLIFFEKTYNTPRTSHVGIYVGNGMMIHCGNPIHYSSIDTAYWRAHFYCFGRLP